MQNLYQVHLSLYVWIVAFLVPFVMLELSVPPVSSADSTGDLQRYRFDSCCFLGQIQDCPSTGETLFS